MNPLILRRGAHRAVQMRLGQRKPLANRSAILQTLTLSVVALVKSVSIYGEIQGSSK